MFHRCLCLCFIKTWFVNRKPGNGDRSPLSSEAECLKQLLFLDFVIHHSDGTKARTVKVVWEVEDIGVGSTSPTNAQVAFETGQSFHFSPFCGT
jgi:hypothetical protein